MTRRRHRTGPGERLLAHALIVWLVWLALTRVVHLPGTLAALAVGVVWGLLAGWRIRGAVERAMRRAVRRLF